MTYRNISPLPSPFFKTKVFKASFLGHRRQRRRRRHRRGRHRHRDPASRSRLPPEANLMIPDDPD